MSRYSPGTLDDDAVLARRRQAMSRQVTSVAYPTGSQLNDTSRKVNEMDIGAVRMLAQSALDAALWAIPLGGMVFMSTNSPPGYGSWKSVGDVQMGGVVLYMFERIADDNDI